jgi:hypothetical protein
MDKMSKITKLERQIKEVERRLSGGFSGIVDRKSRKRDEDKLKKLIKELNELKKKK